MSIQSGRFSKKIEVEYWQRISYHGTNLKTLHDNESASVSRITGPRFLSAAATDNAARDDVPEMERSCLQPILEAVEILEVLQTRLPDHFKSPPLNTNVMKSKQIAICSTTNNE
eukprot:TRINITY_DN12375_c0_g2_i2.p1 TRINITY_DN12375_c0_g2~~TRINITY_DN12375_c0_g2_i2.p1  ORF type:complete len:114 (+),score=8.60 TRINITY_DN12375_c0_g2_i2:442-783(+)